MIRRWCAFRNHPLGPWRPYSYGALMIVVRHCYCGVNGEAQMTTPRQRGAWHPGNPVSVN